MHLEAAIVTLRDALGGRDTARLEMNLEALIGQDTRSTGTWSIRGGQGVRLSPSVS